MGSWATLPLPPVLLHSGLPGNRKCCRSFKQRGFNLGNCLHRDGRAVNQTGNRLATKEAPPILWAGMGQSWEGVELGRDERGQFSEFESSVGAGDQKGCSCWQRCQRKQRERENGSGSPPPPFNLLLVVLIGIPTQGLGVRVLSAHSWEGEGGNGCEHSLIKAHCNPWVHQCIGCLEQAGHFLRSGSPGKLIHHNAIEESELAPSAHFLGIWVITLVKYPLPNGSFLVPILSYVSHPHFYPFKIYK